MKIQAIVFDLDGVITDTSYLHFIAWKELVSVMTGSLTNASKV